MRGKNSVCEREKLRISQETKAKQSFLIPKHTQLKPPFLCVHLLQLDLFFKKKETSVKTDERTHYLLVKTVDLSLL